MPESKAVAANATAPSPTAPIPSLYKAPQSVLSAKQRRELQSPLHPLYLNGKRDILERWLADGAITVPPFETQPEATTSDLEDLPTKPCLTDLGSILRDRFRQSRQD